MQRRNSSSSESRTQSSFIRGFQEGTNPFLDILGQWRRGERVITDEAGPGEMRRYERDFKQRIRLLETAVGPAALMGLGVVVGACALTLYWPLFEAQRTLSY